MQQDILKLLDAKKSGFSKGQRRIAAYITESYDKAAFMTASKLGMITEVSESTVVRFAMELGYDGYPSMQKAMQEMVLNRLTPSQRIGVANDRIGDQDLVSTVLQSDMDKLRQTNETVNREEFKAAVDAILKAKRIYILGVGSSSMLASFTAHYLRYMFDEVRCITSSDTVDMFENLLNISAQDVVIAFSFPRYSATIVKAVRYCAEAGATIVSVTNSAMSSLGKSSDHVLVAKSDMVSLVDSLVGPLSLVNALIVALASARKKTLEKNFTELEKVWREYQVYEKNAYDEL